jgi:uncharacterized protein YecT (DUF1311 family)
MRVAVIGAAALAAIVSTSPARAASFNCDDARLDAEQAVCAHEGLSRLDERLADQFEALRYQLRNDAPALDELHEGQRRFLMRRNDCATDTQCLRRTYVRRIFQLDTWGDQDFDRRDRRNWDDRRYGDREPGDRRYDERTPADPRWSDRAPERRADEADRDAPRTPSGVRDERGYDRRADPPPPVDRRDERFRQLDEEEAALNRSQSR